MEALRRLPVILARQRRRRALARALRFALILLAIHLACLAVLASFSARHPLAPIWLQALAWSYAAYLLVPAVFVWAWRARDNSAAAVAGALDRANPRAPDPFRTSLSLESHDEATRARLDGLLGSWLPSLALPRPRLAPRLHLLLLGSAAALLAVAALASGRPASLLERAAAPWKVLASLPMVRFHLAGIPAVAGIGDTVSVRGRAEGRLPDQPLFAHVRGASGEVRYPLPARGDSFAFVHGPLEGDVALVFAAANGSSPAYRIRVVPPPFLEKLRVILHAPGYTGLRPDTLPQGVAHFSVLPGTRVRWLFSADRELARSEWEFRPAEGPAPGDTGAAARAAAAGTARDSVDRETLLPPPGGPGREFAVERTLRKPLVYAYRLEDARGIRSPAGLPHRIDITPDQPPEVDWTDPPGETALDRGLKLPLAFHVKDDYGVTSLRLVYRVLSGGVVKSEGRRDAGDWLRQAAAGLAQVEWDVKDLRLRPDQVLEYHLVAVDNDTVSGPKAGKSAVRTVRLPTLQEILAATRRQEQSAVANLKSAIQREKQLERKLARETAPREEAPPMAGDYEINRIMVEDPRAHARRTEAILAQARQALERSGQAAGKESDSKARKQAQAQAQAGVQELRDLVKRNEAALPQGNQARLPVEERMRNLDKLLESQKDQAARMAKSMEKAAKAPRAARMPDMHKAQLEEAARDLQRNIESQQDLRKLFQDQQSQARAKAEMAEQTGQEQARLAEDMKAALEDIEKSLEQAQRNGTLSKDLLDKMKKVQDLMREVIPDSLRELLEKRAEGQEVDPRELRDQLRKMMEKQEEMSESLNRALAMLEQLREKRRLEDLRRALSDLQEREENLAERLSKGASPGKPEDEEQKAIQKETQKALNDFAAQAAAAQGANRKPMQELSRELQARQVQKDMEDVREALAPAAKGGRPRAAASARQAAEKLGGMAGALSEALAGMEDAVDIGEANEILQESLELSRLQLLLRSGEARRKAEGWESEEAALYASVAQTAQWIQDRVKTLAAKIPFLQTSLMSEARGLARTARELSAQPSSELARDCLRHNQELSRELLKLMKMAQSGDGGGGGGGGGSSGKSQGQGGSKGAGSLSSQLKGMSGKQMAINQATYQLLQAMLQGRQPGPGSMPGEQGPGGQPGGQQPGGQQGKQGGGNQPGGEGGQGQTLEGLGNREGELGEGLESLAESMGEEGGAAQKLRKLAEEARQLEEDLRQGRVTAEEIREKQERFQTRLLEASTALEERGMSDAREAETARGTPSEAAQAAKAAPETRLLQLLREARRDAKALRLSESQRKYLEEYYENLLTR